MPVAGRVVSPMMRHVMRSVFCVQVNDIETTLLGRWSTSLRTVAPAGPLTPVVLHTLLLNEQETFQRRQGTGWVS